MDASSLLLLALLHGANLGLTCDAMDSGKAHRIVVHEHNPLVTSCSRAALTEAAGLALDVWVARQQEKHPRIVPLVLWAAVAVKIAVVGHDIKHQP
jgi:hypothetical protein